MLDLIADACDLLEELNEEVFREFSIRILINLQSKIAEFGIRQESRSRIAVAKFRQATRAGATDLAAVHRDVAEAAGVFPVLSDTRWVFYPKFNSC